MNVHILNLNEFKLCLVNSKVLLNLLIGRVATCFVIGSNGTLTRIVVFVWKKEQGKKRLSTVRLTNAHLFFLLFYQ